MTRLTVALVVTVAIFLTYQNELGNAFRVEMNPEKFNPLASTDVNVSCVLDEKDARIKEILVLEINREDEVAMVTFRLHSEIKYNTDFIERTQAEGRIESNITESYLTLTLLNPGPKDAGLYTCKVYYMDVDGRLKEKKVSANLTVDSPDVEEYFKFLLDKVDVLKTELKTQRNASSEKDLQLENIIRGQKEETKKLRNKISKIEADEGQDVKKYLTYLLEKVAFLESELETQENASSELDRRLEKMIQEQTRATEETQELKSKIAELETGKDDTLQGITKNQSMELLDLIEKDRVVSAFTAGYNRKDVFNIGDVVIFDDPVMSEGQDYDKKRGLFTAPVKGIYAFHLSTDVNVGRVGEIAIKVNNIIVAATYNANSQSNDQSSTSCVVKLERGAEVSVVVLSPLDKQRTTLFRYPWSLFSGYLVKALW